MADAVYEDFWKFADTNKDGKLTVHELKRAIKNWRPECKPKGHKDPTDEEICKIFNDIDYDGDQAISKAEFVMEMVTKPKRRDGLACLFKSVDKNNDGFLSPEELTKLIVDSNLFDTDVDKVAADIMKRCDKDKNGKISFDEFVGACSKI